METIKKIILLPKYKKIVANIKKYPQAIILVGTSTYNNMGDHLLAIKSIEFLENAYGKNNIIEIPTQIFKRFENQLKKIKMVNPVVISAGGWMGNLWPEDEYMMQRMIKVFCRQKIVIFPQSVFYDSKLDNYDKVLRDANDTYSKCNNLTLFVRESNSYEVARSLINIEKIYKVPDMAFYNATSCAGNTNHVLMTCIRKDRENISKCDLEKIIRNTAKTKGYAVETFDTILKRKVSTKKRSKVIKQLFTNISRAEIVITNRLHGMIIAVLCGCKCIALDNKTHKVEGVYSAWLKNNPKVVLHNEKYEDFECEIDALNSVIEDGATEKWAKDIALQFEIMKNILDEVVAL